MYGPPRRRRGRGGDGGAAGAAPPTPPSPRAFPPAGQSSGHRAQNPPFPVSAGGAAAGAAQYYQYQQQWQQGPGFHNGDFFPFPYRRVNREKAEAAVEKAWADLRASGKGVTSWKVSQSALLALQADSWASLGFKHMNAVPLLDSLIAIEGKINTFIHCFVSVRKITSVHELGVEICKSEGVEKFEELGLGPLLRHPLVEHYFSVPSDVDEVFEITIEDILNCLGTYLYRCKNKEIPVEEFISYLSEKKSVSPKEKLGVRIRSFGLHIKCIKDARRAEAALLKEYPNRKIKERSNTECNPLESSLEEGESSNVSKPVQNLGQDWPFDEIVASFESVPEDTNSLMLDGDNGNQTQISSQSQKSKSQCHCSCHHQSRVVELSLLGMRLVISSDMVIKVDSRKVQKLNLSNEEIDRFAVVWKEVCQKYSAAEVIALMLNAYVPSDKRKRKMQRLFLSYPAVGLLNVVVRSLKCGLIDDKCSFQSLGKHEVMGPSSSQALDVEDMPPTKSGPMVKDSEGIHNIACRVTVDDLIKNVTNYVELNCSQPGEREFPLGKQLAFIKKYHDCETWMATQFSVERFNSLGYGNFFEFLEHNISLFPPIVCEYFIGDLNEKHTLNVALLQDQLQVILFQAVGNLVDTDALTKDYICMLLKKQFPTVSFQMFGTEIERDFSYLVKRGKDDTGSSNCVIFSAALLGCGRNLEVSGVLYDVVCYASCKGSVSSKAAIECLLNAPMLSDLLSWSHWDLVFAPSLGPLLPWLLNGVQTKELLCIATSEGKLVRVDHSATLDEFLEALIKGSSFQAAVKLLSLLPLYGGRNKVPLSLIQCYAQRAIDVMIRNSMACTEARHIDEYLHHGTSLKEKFDLSNNLNGNSVSLYPLVTAAVQYHECGESLNAALNVASNFILDCLDLLPSEFHSFAAEVLISGLRSFTRDAYVMILNVAKLTGKRCMLHAVGLSLGIVEWIEDYHEFSSTAASESLMSSRTFSKASESFHPVFDMNLKPAGNASRKLLSEDCKTPISVKANSSLVDQHYHGFDGNKGEILNEGSLVRYSEDHSVFSEDERVQVATLIIESIRRDEFGIDPSLQHSESMLLKKQHARLGRALHCLSQELYSQDSHLLLELVQNADDNNYPENVDPTIVFILNSTGVVVLNNEQGFSEQNIRALCDIGNSTKKGSGAGYIGRKGIGFKSVFRVTDAPEIHSNGFHVKFDISDGQIGFILPTVISPFDVSISKSLISSEGDQTDSTSWNTCIVLPFGSKFKEGTGMSSIISMFQDLHPSLLLFLHRLRCIMFRNMLSDTYTIMRRETLGDGIIKVSQGNEKMSWLVVSQELQADKIRSDVQTTEISIAFTLQESDNGEYKPHLSQQPVFAFLPLRTYGLKFILQGDFVLPSSREEVDGNSAWNQWLLSEFPALFVTAERSFCVIPCFKGSPGKAITAFMSFVPLVGEVHGFFSHLPHLIINKLRSSNCLLFEGNNVEWIPPCRVLRGWDEQVRVLLPDSLLLQHLGLGYLCRDIILPDALAKALGVEDYGPKILIDIMSSLCHQSDGIKLLGLDWLSSWLIELNNALSIYSTGYNIPNNRVEFDFIKSLQRMPLIPLSDGSYSSVADGPIWLPCDSFGVGLEGRCGPKDFPRLYAKLRTVSTLLFSAGPSHPSTMQETRVDKLIQMMHKIGVHQLSAHEVIRTHILPNLCHDVHINEDEDLMIEYISFIMLHFQYACFGCHTEKSDIISELQKRSIILTNHGYKCPSKEPVHFSIEFGNPINIHGLIDPEDRRWHEIDTIYLNHPSTNAISSGLMKWREFFLELDVTDFVQVIRVEKMLNSSPIHESLKYEGNPGSNLQNSDVDLQTVIDWESPELVHLLSKISSEKSLEKSKYLLEILDKVWDGFFDAKSASYIICKPVEDGNQTIPSFIKSIQGFRWIASSIDEELYYPKDLFYDCETVRSILGTFAPYAVPKVSSEKLLKDIGFKTQVTFEDALTILQSWQSFETPFMASIFQMSKFYNFISEEVALSKRKITSEFKSGCSIFVPFSNNSGYDDNVAGIFLSPGELYWHDLTGCVDRTKEIIFHGTSTEDTGLLCKALVSIYPGLHDFFVDECGVPEMPSFSSYLDILQQLSSVALPSEAASTVFQLFLKLADDLNGGIVKSEEISYLKESLSKLENKVLPTVRDKWVSLHPSFGLICWSDDEELRQQFEHLDNVDFLQFGDLSNEEKRLLKGKVVMLLNAIGIPCLSEVVSREAISYGSEDNKQKLCLVNWVLPYAQRYLLKFHPKTYFHLKEFGLEKISQLQIAVVGKLFYRHNLKGHNSISKKRLECSCLLQGNVLYMTGTSDSHSLFLELSRLFFDGAPELHLANFLLMIINMAEYGSTIEQIEAFILSSQKVPQLPAEETVWSLLSSCLPFGDKTSHQFDIPITIISRKSSTYSRKQGNNSSWPPTDWKGEAKFDASRGGCLRTLSGSVSSISEMKDISSPGGLIHTEDIIVSPELVEERTLQDDSDVRLKLAIQDAETPKGHSSLVEPSCSHDSERNACFVPELVAVDSVPFSSTEMSSIHSELDHEKDRLCLQALTDQSHATGRWGEAIAYKYFSEKLNSSIVKWVNELNETGLPYDLIIGDDEENMQHIEVKTTTSTNKDWFPITTREWQFATERDDTFSIAHVVLLDAKNAKITVFKNPRKLCQQKVLHLAILMSEQDNK